MKTPKHEKAGGGSNTGNVIFPLSFYGDGHELNVTVMSTWLSNENWYDEKK